jgi:hypothetical protein
MFRNHFIVRKEWIWEAPMRAKPHCAKDASTAR